MVTMVSTIANGGTYIQPRVVKGIIDSQTGERKDIEPIKKDRVISEETAQNVLSMMESVVAEGTGKNSRSKRISYRRKNRKQRKTILWRKNRKSRSNKNDRIYRWKGMDNN